jgi:hypothetical protein
MFYVSNYIKNVKCFLKSSIPKDSIIGTHQCFNRFTPKHRLTFNRLHDVISKKIELFVGNIIFDNVTDLINALPGNSSVKTVQHPTVEETVFSVSAVTSRSGGWWSRDMCFL